MKRKNLTVSSRRWIARAAADPFTKEAKRQGFRSRAALKLAQIDQRRKLIRPHMRIADLGAAPGGWAQYAARVLKEKRGRGRIAALDLLPVKPIPGVEIIRASLEAPNAPALIRAVLGGEADLVLCDAAPAATGHKATDQAQAENLAMSAFHLACRILAKEGSLLLKTRQGGTDELLSQLGGRFAGLTREKPPASRADSAEIYLLASGFKPFTSPVHSC